MVNTGHGSTFAYATEVQAYLGAPPLLQASPGAGGVIVSWNSSVTNCVLQSAPSPMSPWTTVTGARQYAGTQTSVTVSPASGQQYFRLQFP
jgi:hypothetical protein